MNESNSQSFVIAEGIKSYVFDNELVLFSETQQRFYHLNEVAGFIWCGLEEHYCVEKISRLLVTTYRISQHEADNDLHRMLNDWEDQQVILPEFKIPVTQEQEMAEPEFALEYDLSVENLSTYFKTHHYQLIDTCFHLHYPTREIESLIHPVFKHLEPTSAQVNKVDIKIVQQKNDFVLVLDEVPLDYCCDIKGLVPMIHANLLKLAYERAGYLMAIHAGTINRNNDGSINRGNNCNGHKECMILPAESGSGKSTLTAALLQRGYGYCTDDMTIIANDTHFIRPVPVSLGIKAGAWSALTTYYPDIEQLPIHQRADEQLIRYLPPPGQSLSLMPQNDYIVKCIVFPRYCKNTTTNLTPVSSAESLCRLTDAGYDFQGQLGIRQADELIYWIRSIKCFSLEYGDLGSAIEEIKKIF